MNTPSKLKDNYDNSLYTGNFIYDLNDSIAKIDSLKIVDSLRNEYSLKKSYYNTKSKKLVGKDVFVDLGKAASQENKFRIKSLGIEKEEKKTIHPPSLLCTSSSSWSTPLECGDVILVQ